jgi:HD-like signal output (HDOD) protein
VEKKTDIIEIVSHITTIPTLPTVVDRMSTLLRNPETSAEEIGRVITTDQALASKVLKLVNSAFYGFPGKISTITHAVVILGFATIKNIVLTASIFKALKRNEKGLTGFNLEEFWLHSIACGAAAKSLSRSCGFVNADEAFIAGLIHDLGKIVFCQYLPKEFHRILQVTEKKKILIYDSEKELFGVTHQEVGGILAKKWNLPSSLQHAIEFHHEPLKTRDHYLLTALVHCADILVRAMDFGNSGDNKIPLMSEQVWKTMKLSSRNLPAILADISEEFEKARILTEI